MYEEAIMQFEAILKSQFQRIERMKNAPPPKDHSALSKIIIGVIDGDGIGPIIMKEARRVLECLIKDKLQSGKIELREIEGLTLENRIAQGKTVPDDILLKIKECDVLLKGPTTTPQKGSAVPNMESANVLLRKELDLFANVRPVRVDEEGIDWTFFRENTEGEYALGSCGIDIDGEYSIDFKVTTDEGTWRIAKAAFDFARANKKTNVAIVTKANIMKKTDGRFSEICHRVAADYPEITTEEWYVDIMSANLLNKALRRQFQVFLLPNLYGDIITDEAAQIQGGVGTAGSANIGSQYAMFEAIHGSAPRMIEQGMGEYADPASILKATEMLLRHIGCIAEADTLYNAMKKCEEEGKAVVTGDKNGATARAYTDQLIKAIESFI